MVDTISKKRRSLNMSRIKGKDTTPELIARKTLYGLGYRYRLHVSRLPGKPDIVLSRIKTVVFVNGCFWHQHKNCKRSTIPKSNINYWKPKLNNNVKRQQNDIKKLEKLGWKVILLWECETNDLVKLKSKISKMMKKKHKNKLRTLDLFAGIGGLRLGFEQAGFETVFANDFDKYCKITYDENFNNTLLDVKDVWKIDIKKLPKYDILLAGFPCQAFSVAGYREGFKDKKGRGNLFFAITRIMSATEPKAFLLENVRHLETHDNKKTFEIISDALNDLGYSWDRKILNSKDHGNIPQNRERIFIVGFLKKSHFNKYKWPKKISLTKNVFDLLDRKVNNKYYYNGKPLFEKIKNYPFKKGTVYQWRRVYVRENKNGVCPTLTANMGTGGHNVPIIKDNKRIRKLTPRECARLQGYSEKFVLPNTVADSKLYKQIGNSVTVPVVKRIAVNIYKAMSS